MTFKLPSRYPPELPVVIASRLVKALGEKLPSEAVLFGPGFPLEIFNRLNSGKPDIKLEREHTEIGFHVISQLGKQMLAYHLPTIEDESDIHERYSVALHVFNTLGFNKVTICDGVYTIPAKTESSFTINDHVNLTGINPLDYWMKHTNPEPFFLDVKDLYINNNSKDGHNIHLATSEVSSFDPLIEVERAGAVSYGPAFCPETILAGYLGMKVHAIAVSLNSGILFEQFFEEISKS